MPDAKIGSDVRSSCPALCTSSFKRPRVTDLLATEKESAPPCDTHLHLQPLRPHLVGRLGELRDRREVVHADAAAPEHAGTLGPLRICRHRTGSPCIWASQWSSRVLFAVDGVPCRGHRTWIPARFTHELAPARGEAAVVRPWHERSTRRASDTPAMTWRHEAGRSRLRSRAGQQSGRGSSVASSSSDAHVLCRHRSASLP